MDSELPRQSAHVTVLFFVSLVDKGTQFAVLRVKVWLEDEHKEESKMAILSFLLLKSITQPLSPRDTRPLLSFSTSLRHVVSVFWPILPQNIKLALRNWQKFCF